MKKYLTVIKTEFQRHLNYRVNIILYVGGNLLELLAQIVIWTAIFKNLDVVRGYNYSEMMSYVVIGWFFSFLTSNYGFESKIAEDIHDGTLSNFLTKPISYLRYMMAVSLGRITIAFFVVVVQCLIFIAIFYDKINFDLTFNKIIVLFVMLIFTYFIKLYFAFVVGTIAFWTTDITGIHYAFDVVIKFLSGAFFPMLLLSAFFVKVSMFFPFVYTFFIPVQLYLGKITILEGLQGLAVQVVWLILLHFIIKMIWKRGLKKYESVGV